MWPWVKAMSATPRRFGNSTELAGVWFWAAIARERAAVKSFMLMMMLMLSDVCYRSG